MNSSPILTKHPTFEGVFSKKIGKTNSKLEFLYFVVLALKS